MPAPASLPLKTFAVVGLISLVLYIAVFALVENTRRKAGPWELTFTQTDAAPTLQISQARLGLSNITIVFAAAVVPTNLPQTIRFQHGQVATSAVALPFGQCVFLDTLYLPGTVACEIFGHEIQILPRTLTIDRVEHPWRSGEKILLTNRVSATLSPN
jgi:hypothetical protein